MDVTQTADVRQSLRQGCVIRISDAEKAFCPSMEGDTRGEVVEIGLVLCPWIYKVMCKGLSGWDIVFWKKKPELRLNNTETSQILKTFQDIKHDNCRPVRSRFKNAHRDLMALFRHVHQKTRSSLENHLVLHMSSSAGGEERRESRRREVDLRRNSLVRLNPNRIITIRCHIFIWDLRHATSDEDLFYFLRVSDFKSMVMGATCVVGGLGLYLWIGGVLCEQW